MDLLSYLYPSALAAMLMGLIMTVRRVFAGYVLVVAVAVGVLAFQLYLADFQLNVRYGVQLTLLVLLGVLGLSVEFISDRLHLRVGWIGQNTVWGGLIGGMIGLFVFSGAFWMLVGTLVGTVAIQFRGMRGGDLMRPLKDGLEGFFAMFGSDGLRLLLAVVVIDMFLDLSR